MRLFIKYAIGLLFCLYCYSAYTKGDYSPEKIRTWAENGYTFAQLMLARNLYGGNGVEKKCRRSTHMVQFGL